MNKFDIGAVFLLIGIVLGLTSALVSVYLDPPKEALDTGQVNTTNLDEQLNELSNQVAQLQMYIRKQIDEDESFIEFYDDYSYNIDGIYFGSNVFCVAQTGDFDNWNDTYFHEACHQYVNEDPVHFCDEGLVE